jgi:COP9 signalosome complex subunit 7
VALSKSANSPRAAADLVTRATSNPNTFLFTELLYLPQINALRESEEYSSYLALLKIFSYGTYEAYTTSSNLPPLNDAQLLKLRQLSLLTLARDRANLSYDALSKALGLSGSRALEDLVISAIYAGLLDATLDPYRQAVQVNSVAPLRDLAPSAIPPMIAALQAWSSRCSTTLSDLESQIASIKATALRRAQEKQSRDEKLKRLIEEAKDPNAPLAALHEMGIAGSGGSGSGQAQGQHSHNRKLAVGIGSGTAGVLGKGGQRYGKRGASGLLEGDELDDEAMELDEEDEGEADGKKRASRRKL